MKTNRTIHTTNPGVSLRLARRIFARFERALDWPPTMLLYAGWRAPLLWLRSAAALMQEWQLALPFERPRSIQQLLIEFLRRVWAIGPLVFGLAFVAIAVSSGLAVLSGQGVLRQAYIALLAGALWFAATEAHDRRHFTTKAEAA